MENVCNPGFFTIKYFSPHAKKSGKKTLEGLCRIPEKVTNILCINYILTKNSKSVSIYARQKQFADELECFCFLFSKSLQTFAMICKCLLLHRRMAAAWQCRPVW